MRAADLGSSQHLYAGSRVTLGRISSAQLSGCGVAFRSTPPTSHEQIDEFRYEGPLVPCQTTRRFIETTNQAEPTKLARQAITLDPPQALDQLDEGDASGIRGGEKICRRRACARRTRWIEQGSDVSGIAAHGCTQCSHRETGAIEDLADCRSELVVAWWHSGSFRGSIELEDGCWKRKTDVI